MAERLHSIARMLLHRSFAASLLASACTFAVIWHITPAWLLQPPAELAPAPPAVAAAAEGACPAACVPRAPAVSVVDIAAAAATPDLVGQVIRIAGDERVTMVDERPVGSDLAAGAWIAARLDRGLFGLGGIRGGDYMDVTIESPGCAGARSNAMRCGESIESEAQSRRVLVLFH